MVVPTAQDAPTAKDANAVGAMAATVSPSRTKSSFSVFGVIEGLLIAATFAIAATTAYRISLYAVEDYGRGEATAIGCTSWV